MSAESRLKKSTLTGENRICRKDIEGKPVLGSAQTGLVFTRSQEGTQPGRLTQTGQTHRVFDTMCHHAGF